MSNQISKKYAEELYSELIIENINYQNVFLSYAKKLMNEYSLKIDNKEYSITEIEFYFYDKEKHPDPYIHLNKEQNNYGTFYFHGSGIDLTFGRDKSYGGILIRGIKNKSKYFNGPLKLIEELFGEVENINEENKLKLTLIKKNNDENYTVYFSTRVGLQPHPLDYELLYKSDNKFIPYIFRLYRFIENYNSQLNKCKDKTKVSFYEHLENPENKNRPKYKQDSK